MFWGDNANGQSPVPGGLSGVTATVATTLPLTAVDANVGAPARRCQRRPPGAETLETSLGETR